MVIFVVVNENELQRMPLDILGLVCFAPCKDYSCRSSVTSVFPGEEVTQVIGPRQILIEVRYSGTESKVSLIIIPWQYNLLFNCFLFQI